MATIIGQLRVMLGLDSGPFTRGAGQANRSLAGLRQNMMALSAAAAAAGAAAFAMVNSVARQAAEVERSARLANASTTEFQRMAAAAATVGIGQEKLADILKDVNDRVGDFLQTGGGEMADFFENVAPQVGVTADMFRDLSGPEALQLYVDTLNRAGLNQQEMTFYMEAMADEATGLLPLLANNGAEMDRLGAVAQESGAIMSESLIEKSGDFRFALTELQMRLTGVRNDIAERLLPIFTEMIVKINEHVMPVIRDMIGTVGGWMEAFRDLPAPVQEAVMVIVAAIGAGGPLLVAVAAAGAAFRALVAATGPIGLFIAAAPLLTAAWVAWGEDIRAAIGPAIDWVGEKFQALVDWIQGVIDKAAAAKQALVDMFTFENPVADPRGPIPAARDPYADVFLPVGEGIADGLVSGLEDSDAAQRLREYVDSLRATAEDELEIRSPSRVFQRIGQHIAEGLGLGLRDGRAEVAEAMAGTVDATTSAIEGAEAALSSLRGAAQSAFTGLVTGTHGWRDALGGVLRSLGNILANRAFEGLFGRLFQGGSLLGGFFESFEGGGYTGPGARSGGIDGRGGFLAMLHPNESVIDHAGGGPGGRLDVRVYVDQDGQWRAAVSQISDSRIRAASRDLADQAEAQVLNRLAGSKLGWT